MPSRIEREIEEILTRLDEFVPEESRARRLRRRMGALFASLAAGLGGFLRRLTRGLNGGHILLAAAILLVLTLFLRGSFPTFARWATYVAVAVIFVAIIMSIRPIQRSRSGRYWRGEPIDLRRPSPFMRLRMWWRRRNRPRL